MQRAVNPSVLLGVFFEALFFVCLLVLMAESDISFLWPLTALSFVLTRIGSGIWNPLQGWDGWPGARHAMTSKVSGADVMVSAVPPVLVIPGTG